MSPRELRKYVKILRSKAKRLIEVLPEIDPTTSAYRDAIINFNNTFSNIQQYEMLITELEAEEPAEQSED